MRALAALCLGLLAGSAAASGTDYASQWPVTLPAADAGLYRVVLAPEVYSAAQSPRLDDVDLVDADGQPVSAQLFAPEGPSAATVLRTPLPWFALPQAQGAQADDIALAVERAADGSVRRVETRLAARSVQAPSPTAWLVDSSRIEGGIVALLLDWRGAPDPLEAAYRIEGSDDLRQWRVLQPRATLLDLTRNGQRLRQHRLPVDAAARYLRLVPLSGAAGLELTRVEAERVAGSARPLPTQWRELSPRAATGADAPGSVYELDGRFPVESVDLALAGSGTGEWRLYSRDRSDAPWVHRAGPWLGYRIAPDQRSPPQPLARTVRDRYWKLEGAPAPAQPPALLLGWRPESLVFVAGDAPPYRLVAGSTRATRVAAPVAQSLQAVRAARGQHWQPPVATLGEASALSGEAALRPVRDWRSWLLWALLVAGALLVTGFALNLLRKPRQ